MSAINIESDESIQPEGGNHVVIGSKRPAGIEKKGYTLNEVEALKDEKS